MLSLFPSFGVDLSITNVKKMMGLSACFVLLACSIPAYSQSSVRWQSVDYLLDCFIEIAMRNEYSSGPSPVRKWRVPINYFFVHRVADKALHENITQLHLSHLSAITGLSIRPAKTFDKANLLIIFSTESNFQKELATEFGIYSKRQRKKLFYQSVCIASIATAPNKEIIRALVVIPVDRARAQAKLVECIVEELTQILGLPNDSEKVFPSIFNDKSVNSLLTGLDYLLLKMLYDPRVKTGMKQEEVMPVLRKIAMEYKNNNKFKTAEKEVRIGPLYELLD